MSSKNKRGWSEWAWSPEYNRKYRSRLKSSGEYEYEYGPLEASQEQSGTSALEGPTAQYSGYQTSSPAYSTSETVAFNQAPASQYSQYYQTSPYSTQTTGTASLSQALGGLSLAQNKESAAANHIAPTDVTTDKEALDPNFKVQPQYKFKWGEIFKIFWTEPSGDKGMGRSVGSEDSRTRNWKFGQKPFQKVRRFVIVDSRDGHCICLPIHTYSGQGVMKRGVHAKDHAIIYTEKAPKPLNGEREKGLSRKPIRMEPSSSRHHLDQASRLNYAKLYTVEYNVKVWFIGKVHRDSRAQLTAEYNDVHPALVVPKDNTIPEGQVAQYGTYGVESGHGQYGLVHDSTPRSWSDMGYSSSAPSTGYGTYGVNTRAYGADTAGGYSDSAAYGEGVAVASYGLPATNNYPTEYQTTYTDPTQLQGQYASQEPSQEDSTQQEELYSDDEYDRYGQKKGSRKKKGHKS